MLRVVLGIQLLLLRDADSCELWEYSKGRECCPKCNAGFRVLRHCTVASSTNCIPCSPGWFTEHPNGLMTCLKCRECDPGIHLQVKEKCHYLRNTQCICQPGFFCSHRQEEDSCDACVKHTVAPPGFQVLQAGTERNDTKFEHCPQGTFSAKEMSFSCTKWTNCINKGMIEKQAGNATSDAVCELPEFTVDTGTILIASLTSLLLLLLLMVLSIIIWKKGKCPMKAFDRKKIEGPHHTIPEAEYMVTPIQETTQNLGQPSYAIS